MKSDTIGGCLLKPSMDSKISSKGIFVKEDVDALFSKWDVPHCPGCALGIIYRGELIYSRGYGWGDLEHDVPITTKSVFDLASTSKQFTAMCVALLIEAGKLSLDDDIREYLPELPDLGEPVTIRHLIHHTSGWRDYLELMELKGMGDDDFYTDGDILEMLARQRHLNFKPGDDFLYSNTGYYLLGIIVQRASGLSLRRFAEENIFKPLGMVNTRFYDDHNEIDRERAIGYAPAEQGGYRISMASTDMVGDGNLYTTVEDLYLWDQNFYQNKLGSGSSELLDLMHTCGVKNDGSILDYAFGLEIKDYRGQRLVCHSGGFVGYRSDILRFPEHRLTVICLANLSSIDPSKLAKGIADMVLANILEESIVSLNVEHPFEVTDTNLAEITGLYWNPGMDLILELKVEAKKLLGESAGTRVEFAAQSPGLFRSSEAPFEIKLHFTNQKERELDLIIEDEAPIRLAWIEPVTLTSKQLLEYTGYYYSVELDTTYQVVLSDGSLYLKYRNAPTTALRSALTDVLWVDHLLLYFTRHGVNGEVGAITGFTVNTGRVKGILFQKME